MTLALALGLSACAGSGPRGQAPSGSSVAADTEVRKAREVEYRLGAGDRLRVIVFNEPDLSGEFEVDGTGVVAIPLVGKTDARGATLREFEERIATKLRDGYIRDPRVSVEVLNFRPFYIIGEVQNGGEYPYVPDMTVLNAIALAGGYTYRADERRVYITKGGDSHETEFATDQGVSVLPGDIIRVPERLF